ncbi:FAD-binding and (Fe-S)-binding domain-containing protein [Aquisalimonas lutea]|uniref:FAD-binding and (Fe-S)-binding domain-containing protein n=1 Tax=Aquisalimonas lutea TaxID=1327750 RepID=UPI0025B4F1D3|nr:FAD-binding and (Fe-S)-binding domain-containing protein [Aquisalimonas lutea]MDN3516283.1 FAD-binding and (Fe-S)-binding domain-containing protein [Aquisalimonas lutea]
MTTVSSETSDSRPHAADAFAAALRDAGFSGEIAADAASRLLAATDNSVYQVTPSLVLFPANGDDLQVASTVAGRAEHRAVSLVPRGGGTGTNGQALSSHVVVDTSRHTNRILHVDAAAERVRVEPGVVLAQLNAALAEHDLFFPPSTSTASRATIGGMIGTDACGKGSRAYGRTGDYVESLELLLPDGRAITCRRYAAEELAGPDQDPGVALAREVHAILAGHREAIRERFPDLNRSLTGYNLRDALGDDGSVDLARLVTGAEGTLGMIRSATLRLRRRPHHKAVVVIRYEHFDAALRDAQWLLESAPSAVETLDDRLYHLARQDSSWPRVAAAMAASSDHVGDVITNFVEFSDDTRDRLQARVDALTRRLQGRGSSFHVTFDDAEMAELWNIRSRSVGMLGRTAGNRKPVPFIEDTVVPPEHLADYIAELRALLDDHGVDYAMFGHVDVGCLHVRPALDLTVPEDKRLLRVISDQVVELLQRYHGLLWGEHGKGFRGEYTRSFFGDTLYAALGQIKAAFDPDNRMNPGKIVAPDAAAAAVTPIDGVPLRGDHDARIPGPVRGAWSKAIACNGNGVCFDWDVANTLCPSYKATRDRIHSPKGRAMLLREWLQSPGGDTTDGARRPGLRRRRRTGDDDIAHAVHDAMAGCLGCKACATQCPVHVDIPEMRARFLDAYHRRYRRPLRDYLLAGTEQMAPWMARAGGATRWLLGTRPARAGGAALGIVDAPVPARPAGLRAARGAGYEAARTWAAARDSIERASLPVAVLPDAFTAFFESRTLPAVCGLIRALGYTPIVLPYQASGKALHAHGFLDRFRRTAAGLLGELEGISETGAPVLAIEPSIGLFLRDEARAATPGRSRAAVHLLAEWLAERACPEPQPARAGSAGEPYRLLLHCTEKTATPAASQWQQAFRHAGLALETVASGCCGMAGAYGHQSEHQATSRTLYRQSWAPTVTSTRAERLLATGYSCRSQSERLGGVRPRHPAEVLAAAHARAG